MAYNALLAGRIRNYLFSFPELKVEEKEMFRGLTFMVNDKMCVCVSGENLMCRFDPDLLEEVAERPGFNPMVMKGRELKGYCYVEPDWYNTKNHFKYWVNLCLNYNEKAKASKKQKQRKAV